MVSLYMFVLTKLKPVQRLADWSSLSPLDWTSRSIGPPKTNKPPTVSANGWRCSLCSVQSVKRSVCSVLPPLWGVFVDGDVYILCSV